MSGAELSELEIAETGVTGQGRPSADLSNKTRNADYVFRKEKAPTAADALKLA